MVDGVRGPGAGAAPLPRAGAARGGGALEEGRNYDPPNMFND